MGRWEPNARGRLERAAMELYAERGFEQTTVAEIAERAGLTKRTFFRHFADKRDVLFSGSPILQELVVRAVAAAPGDASPIAAVGAGLEAAAAALQERADAVHVRQSVISANPELQERELIKLATLGAAVAEAARARGTEPRAAALAAQAGLAAFRIAFEEWAVDAEHLDLAKLIRAALADMRSVTAGE